MRNDSFLKFGFVAILVNYSSFFISEVETIYQYSIHLNSNKMYTIKTFFQNAVRTDRFANPEGFLLCLFLVFCFFCVCVYHGTHSSEQATFTSMPALDREMTPYERFFKETALVNVNADLVHIRLQNGQDTFAVWPRSVPLVVLGSKVKVSSFLSVDKAYYVKQ